MSDHEGDYVVQVAVSRLAKLQCVEQKFSSEFSASWYTESVAS